MIIMTVWPKHILCWWSAASWPTPLHLLLEHYPSHESVLVIKLLSNFLIIINSCSNFFVYLVKDPKFLLAFKRSVLRSSENSSSSGSRNETFRRSRRQGDMLEMTALQLREAVPEDNVSTGTKTMSSNTAALPSIIQSTSLWCVLSVQLNI